MLNYFQFRYGSKEGYGFVHYANTPEGIAAAINAAHNMNDVTIDGVLYKVGLSKSLRKKLQELMGGYPVYPMVPPPPTPSPMYGASAAPAVAARGVVGSLYAGEYYPAEYCSYSVIAPPTFGTVAPCFVGTHAPYFDHNNQPQVMQYAVPSPKKDSDKSYEVVSTSEGAIGLVQRLQTELDTARSECVKYQHSTIEVHHQTKEHPVLGRTDY